MMQTKRRPRGEGSVRKVGPGRWEVRVWAGKRRLQRTLPTQREALAARDELKAIAATGAPLPAKGFTVDQLLVEFLNHGRTTRDWAPSTSQVYETVVRRHLSPRLGDRKLATLRPIDVQCLIDDLAADGFAPQQVSHICGTLRSALGHAMRREIVPRNVAARESITLPRIRRRDYTGFTVTQVGALLDALDGHRLRSLVAALAYLGLRRGEAIALRWSEIDLETRSLRVVRTGSRVAREYTEGPPKSEKSRRPISLPAILVEELRANRIRQNEDRLGLGAIWQDENRVWPSLTGGPLSATMVRRTLDAATKRAGLPHLRVHDLRHSAATNLVAGGGTLNDAQEMLGHANISLTSSLYKHAEDSQQRATAARIDALIRTSREA